jgi:flavin reductase (DIM6/NTAB) family NADH-FMN oxidoreductase RutF
MSRWKAAMYRDDPGIGREGTSGHTRVRSRNGSGRASSGQANLLAVDAKVRQKTLRMLSNGVYVMTSRSEGRLGAATVSWVSQASFRPPLLMAAVRRQSKVFQCMAERRIAALHIVGDSQQEIARRFFFPTQTGCGTINGEPFAEGATAAPILANLPAHVECRVERIVDTDGDHAVVILRVLTAECPVQLRPLTIAESPWEYGG